MPGYYAPLCLVLFSFLVPDKPPQGFNKDLTKSQSGEYKI